MEWDDLERDKMAALVAYEDGVCECGFHRSVAQDPNTHYEFPITHCPVCGDVAVKMRKLRAEDDAEIEARTGRGENARELPPEAPRPDDGRHVGIRLLTEAEIEQRKAAIAEAQAVQRGAKRGGRRGHTP